jgi:hypothetical protein
MATVTITVGELRKAARWARPGLGNPLPVLGDVRVSVTGGQLVLAVFDGETLLMAAVPGAAADPGRPAAVLVPAGHLAAAVEVLPAKGPVEVTVHDGDKVDLVTGGGTTRAQRISVGQEALPV